MPYRLCFGLNMGAANAGLTLSSQLVDTTGASVGALITTGFVDMTGGHYLWDYAGFPNGHRGGVKFLAGSTLKAFAAINPEEGEFLDVPVSTRAAALAMLAGNAGFGLGAFLMDFADFAVSFTEGDRYLLPLTFTIDGVAPDVSAYTQFWFTAKRRVGDLDAAAVFQKTFLAGAITKTNAALGLLLVSIAEADTRGLPLTPLRLFCDLRGKDGAGDIHTGARGVLVVLPAVSLAAT